MTITAVPDVDLAARFVRDAWPFIDVLARGARRLTLNDADAEDLLQDTMLHAYNGFHTFQEGTNLRAWLFRILHNRWINNYRWRQRRPAEVLAGEIADWELVGRSTPRSAESEVVDALPDNDVRAAMDSLSDGFRMAVYYADIQGHTYAETAALMGVPVGTVMSRVSRARSQLRRALADKHCARGHRTPELVA